MNSNPLPPTKPELRATMAKLFATGKGLLAADESTKSANARFAALEIEQTEGQRRQWRQLLLMTHNIEDFISGVILYDETFRQRNDEGILFPQALENRGVVPGIKVDMGLVDLTNFPSEKVTEGLDGLNQRLSEYYKLGARFAKWRAAFPISPTTPSEAAIHANANVFGRYASLCQANGIVPIIEPEVLYDGDHSIDDCEKAVIRVLTTTIEVVEAYRVDLAQVIVKTSMVMAGKANPAPSSPAAVAAATVRALQTSLPSKIGGVIFLSGGQTPVQATENFNAIARQGKQAWPITFSFSRAVQDPAMKLWAGDQTNIEAAQKVFYHRLACNSAARAGQYDKKMEIF